MGSLFVSILLFVVATILFISLLPLAIILHILYAISNFSITSTFSYLRDIFYTMALAIDKIGCVLLAPILNVIALQKNTKYKFGDINQTISYVLAINLPFSYTKTNLVKWESKSFLLVRIPTPILQKKKSGNVTNVGWFLVVILETLDPGHMRKSLKDQY